MNRRLFIGPAPMDFDLNKDVAAGPWCFVGKEKIFSEWAELDFVEPFDTPEKLIEAEIEIAHLVEYFIQVWAVQLNKIHNLERPLIFWRRYLNFWVSLICMATWARWRNAMELVSLYSEIDIKVMLSPKISPPDFPDFHAVMFHLLSNPRFQWSLDSNIFSRLAPINWCLIESKESIPDVYYPKPDPNSMSNRLVRRILPRLPLNH